MTDDLTRQDEDMPPAAFAADERHEGFDFGNWPEIAGAVLAAALVWASFAFTG